MSLTTIKAAKVASPFNIDINTFTLSLSDAEARVIQHKAERAGVSIHEYIRNAALGFPMG